MTTEKSPVLVNGIRYRWPQRPVVVVCIDGGDPAYLRRFFGEGALPNIARFIDRGFGTVADGSMPSFTCPNNMSIITGTPASRHGISDNYYLDVNTGKAVVMTGPELLRGDTNMGRFTFADTRQLAQRARTDDYWRREFVGLTELAERRQFAGGDK